MTGCPNSCAQHYIGDIGLQGTQVEVEEEMVEGYHMVIGGGWGARTGRGATFPRFPAVREDPAHHRAADPRIIWPTGPAPTNRSPPLPAATTIDALRSVVAEEMVAV